MKRRIPILATLVAVIVFAAACGGGDDDDAGQAGTTTTTDKSPILIGIDMAKTGPNAAYDLEPAQAAQLAIEEVNAAGGVLGRQLEAKWLDSKSDPVLGGSNAVELVDGGAVALLVACDFDLGAAGATEAAKERVPAFSCAADPKFGDTKTLGPYAFQLNATTANQSAVMAEWAYNAQGWKNAYVLQDQSLEFSKSLGRFFTARFEELGGTIVGSDTWNALKDTEFGPMITRFQSSGEDADVIWLPSWIPAAATLIRQFRAAGIDTPFMCGDACDGELLTDTAGAVSDVYYVNLGCYAYCDAGGSGSPRVQEFVDAYTEKYDRPPATAYALTGYDAVLLIAEAIKRAEDTDGDAIREALETFDGVEALSGSFTFTAKVHSPVNKTLSVVQVQDGKFSLVEQYTPESVPS